jgi:F-type H+-transporting ATPase subunit b
MHQPLLGTVVAESEHPLIDIDGTLFIQFGLFLVMAFLVTHWLFKPYLRMREERDKGIHGARQEAENMSAEADARLVDYEAKLAEARSRAYDEQRKLRTEAAGYQAEVTTKARDQAHQALDESRASMNTQVEAARAELLPQAETLASQIAGKLLGREVA